MGQIGVTGAFAGHSQRHEIVDNRRVRRAGADFQKRGRLIGHFRIGKAVGRRLFLSGGAGFHGKGQIRKAFHALIILRRIRFHNHNLRVLQIGIGAFHRVQHFFRQRHAVPDNVNGFAVEFKDLVVPVHDLEDRFHAERVRERAGHIRVKADPFAVRVLIVDRFKLRDAHNQRPLVQYILEIAVRAPFDGGRRLFGLFRVRAVVGVRAVIGSIAAVAAAGSQGNSHNQRQQQGQNLLFHPYILQNSGIWFPEKPSLLIHFQFITPFFECKWNFS